jgi:hypothetical protein
MVRFDGLLGEFCPPAPERRIEPLIATQAGGSAGPLPADPPFFYLLLEQSAT